MIDWSSQITRDPGILVGKPVVRGTRLSVEFILSLYASGWTSEQVLANYPTLKADALLAVFAYAVQAVRAVPPLGEPETE